MKFEILVDKSESVTKCTILPLEYRADFEIRRFTRNRPIAPLSGDFLLHPEGRLLTSPADVSPQVGKISLIDCNWRRLGGILDHLERPWPELVRIPEDFVTAYPRRNKQGLDPENGLATIEALFIAAAFCGVWDETLLKEYYFAPRFLEMNKDIFYRYGLLRSRP